MWFAVRSSTSASYFHDLTTDAQSKKSSKKKAAEEYVLKLLHEGITMGYLNNAEDKMWLIKCAISAFFCLVLILSCSATGHCPLSSFFNGMGVFVRA